jgi:two-component system sensor kinase FixL
MTESIRSVLFGGPTGSDVVGQDRDRVHDAGHQPKVPERNRRDDARFWLAAIADSSDDAIVGKDLTGRVTSWNKAAETMFGYSADEIIGLPITRIIPVNRIEEETSILERIRRGERIVHFETKRQRKDSAIIPVSLTVSPIRDDSGRIIGVSKTARDLSAMERIHADLERREALLRSILNTVPDALIVIDKRGCIHSFSAAAVQMFGYSSEAMMGRDISVLLPFSNWDQYNSALTGYSATGDQPIIGLGQRNDDSTFPMQLSIGEVNLPNMRLFTAFVRDLTEQTERERLLQAANDELQALGRSTEGACETTA